VSESANPPDAPWIELAKWPYAEPVLHFRIRAADGGWAAEHEFYLDRGEMAELGRRLEAFSAGGAGEIILSLGERHGAAAWLHLRVWVADSSGRAALTLDAGNAGSGAARREACFTIRCDVAALNDLGARLVRWLDTDAPALRAELTSDL
jgi:hypothetical protein